jgi:hypothetical protein
MQHSIIAATLSWLALEWAVVWWLFLVVAR